MRAGDINGDGTPDLVVGHAADSRIAILFGLGSGAFAQPAQLINVAAPPPIVELADFDSDGKLDIVAGRATDVILLLNRLP